MQDNIKKILYPIFLAVAIVIGIFIGMYSALRYVDRTNIGSNLGTTSYKDNKLVYLLSMVDRLYVDSVNIDSLTEDVLPKVLADLDPHSVYIPAEDFAEVNEQLDGEFDGIGVVFNMTTDTVVVLNVMHGGPSDKAGMLNGDRIMTINDSLVAGQNIEQTAIVNMLRGKRGTKVDLGVKRANIEELVPLSVKRDKVAIKSLTAAFMIEPEVGYIRLSAFSKTSYVEVMEALQRLSDIGMKRLVFDLRGNTGGFLDQAIRIANEFLPPKKLIVYTENRERQQEKMYSNGEGAFPILPLVMIIDEGSASSSEILAGAIQDNDRGIVVGRRSYGKGLVQQQIPFRDHSAVRLTIARYFTPTGRSIQRPYDEGSDVYSQDIAQRYMHQEMFTADSIKFDDSLKYTTPEGRVVYGGGGIMPDVFVPLDTSKVSNYYSKVWGKNILYRYTLDYSDRHRDELNNIKSVDDLNKLLDGDKNLLQDFINYASKNGVPPNYKDIAHSESLMKAQLRANIGRNTVLEDVGFYSQMYREDNAMIKALNEVEEL